MSSTMTIVMNTLEDFRQLSQVCSGKVCLNIPSSSIAVSFTVNFIMGCGFLGVPWGFNEAGIGTGILTLFLATGVCLITAFLLLETMARAEATTRTEYLVSTPIQRNSKQIKSLSTHELLMVCHRFHRIDNPFQQRSSCRGASSKL